MYIYEDTLYLSDDLTIGTYKALDTAITGVGEVLQSTYGHITFRITGEDLWELRETLSDLESEVRSWGGDLTINRDKVRESK